MRRKGIKMIKKDMKRWEWKVSKEFKVNKSWKAKNGEKPHRQLARSALCKERDFLWKGSKGWKGEKASEHFFVEHINQVSKYQNKNKVMWLKGKSYRNADILIICWAEGVLHTIFDIWRLIFLKTTVKINLHLALSLSLSGIQFSQNVKSNFANL